MASSSGFEEIYGDDGLISKVRANFGRNKEVCMNGFNGKTYVHITDKSKCFVDGKFEKTKSKSVTLNYEEATSLRYLIEQGKPYDTAFHHYGAAPGIARAPQPMQVQANWTPQPMQGQENWTPRPMQGQENWALQPMQGQENWTVQPLQDQRHPSENWGRNADNLIAIPLQPKEGKAHFTTGKVRLWKVPRGHGGRISNPAVLDGMVGEYWIVQEEQT